MKRILIISPHFPPVNAPDMQRVRMSLPYYKEFGWDPVVICVDEQYVSGFRDELLNETIPPDIEVHRIKAFSRKSSRLFGLGNISLRAYFQFRKKGNELLKKEKFDLVFFSTSQFYVCALGPYWKRKFNVPFIIDMQDPWRNDFYLQQPRHNRPRKFRLNHLVNKFMEGLTMPNAGGILSVSQSYINILKNRYSALRNKPSLLLPFGIAESDFDLVKEKNISPLIIDKNNGKINVVYVGVLNNFFMPLLRAFFSAFAAAVADKEQYHFYFIGTNYAEGIHQKPVEDLAEEIGLRQQVTEIPVRIPYFSGLSTILNADILFIPGSTDAAYNASKVYNNLYTNKPIFSIFNEQSLVKKAIDEAGAGIAVGIHEDDDVPAMIEKIKASMPAFALLHLKQVNNTAALSEYLARNMVQQQVQLFDAVAPAAKKAVAIAKTIIAIALFIHP